MTAAQAREIDRLSIKIRQLEEALAAQKVALGNALDREAEALALIAKLRAGGTG